jgi:hypothetical protein
MYQVVLPSLSVGSVMLSIWWAADVFNLSDLCWKKFVYLFIDQENFKVSIIKLTIVICLWFFFSYISKTMLRLIHLHYVTKDPDSAESRTVMTRNVIQVIIWGAWLLISLSVLHISVEWLLAWWARTVSVAFSSSTPCSAHRVRLPEGGTGVPKSCSISLKIFCSDGGNITPSCTEKLSPWACPGSWYGSCPIITTFTLSNGVRLKALNINRPGG